MLLVKYYYYCLFLQLVWILLNVILLSLGNTWSKIMRWVWFRLILSSIPLQYMYDSLYSWCSHNNRECKIKAINAIGSFFHEVKISNLHSFLFLFYFSIATSPLHCPFVPFFNDCFSLSVALSCSHDYMYSPLSLSLSFSLSLSLSLSFFFSLSLFLSLPLSLFFSLLGFYSDS